jgi:Predicted transcriptional regulators
MSMDNQKMGNFIFIMRKENKMTQKELAQRLHITDKAVSKWERGLSCPDLSLISSLAEVLGVTVNELLNGEREDTGTAVKAEKVEPVLQYADETTKKKVRSLKILFADAWSLILLLGILVCSIVDLAVSGTFTWSLISDSSILLAWFAGYPVIRSGHKGVGISLAAVSILIFPYLYVLHLLVPSGGLLLPVGMRMAVIAVVYAWIIYGLFCMLRNRKYLAGAIVFVLYIPVQFLVNFCLSITISEPLMDEWDILSAVIMVVAAVVFWRLDAKGE